MKKIIILGLVGILNHACFAQESEDPFFTRKPAKGDIGLGFSVSGAIANIFVGNTSDTLGGNFLFGRYYLKDDLVVRVGFGVNSGKGTFTFSDSVSTEANYLGTGQVFLDQKTTISSNSFFIRPGIEKHFEGTKKLDPYVGADLTIALKGRTKTVVEEAASQTDYTRNSTQETVSPGGLGFGISLLGGFNYFIAKNLAIGAECSWGFRSNNLGGESESTYNESNSGSDNFLDGTNINTTNSFNSKSRSSGFGVNASGAIKLSIFFSCKDKTAE